MSVEEMQDISHYHIIEKLGEGGMGVVYKAMDNNLKRNVALKFIPPNLTTHESTRKRFIVEARAASSLDHPNICTIHEINKTDDGQLYICMAYYEGESLRDRLKKGPIPFEQAVKIISHIADGLQAAHNKGIVHRDIKPGNIILTKSGEVKLVDFGLAKLAGVDLTQSTSSKGTAAYMCPEQVRGEKVDHRCDIWALGVVFFEMLTGHLPFRGDYPEPVMFSIVNEPHEPLSKYLSDVPDNLQDVIDKLLKKDPDQRYQNLPLFINDLRSFADSSDLPVVHIKSKIVKILQNRKTYIYATAALIFVILWSVFKPQLAPQYTEEPTIAVLPMQNFTDAADQEWFSDGMTDAITSKLAQVSGLKVISRTSAMVFKNSSFSIPEIGDKLNADYLVESSLGRMDNYINLSARLIDVANDKSLWAADFEREEIHILELQAEIARTIANQVNISLTPEEENLLIESREIDPQIWTLYSQGMYFLDKRTPESLEKGFDLLNKAVELDPEEPLAWAGLSLGHSIMAHTPNPTEESHELAKHAALKALDLDNNLAEAHLALAMVKIYYEWDLDGAENSYKRALQLNPNHAYANMHYGYFLALRGRAEEIATYIQKAKQLDPLSPVYPAEIGWSSAILGNYDLAIQEAKKSLELSPDFPFALFALGAAYAGKGMYDEAIEVQKRSAKLSPDWKWGLAYTYAKAGMREKALATISEFEKEPRIWDTWCIACVYAALDDADKTFYWLEQAFKRRHPYMPWLNRAQEAYFGHYKNDPRFIDLVKRMGLAI